MKATESGMTIGIALENFDEYSEGDWIDLANQKAAQSATFGGSQNNPSNPILTAISSIANQQNLSSATVDNSGGAGPAGSCTPETPLSRWSSNCSGPNTNLSYQQALTKVKTGKILVFVNLGYSKLDEVITGSRTSVGSPTSNGWSVDQSSGKVNVSFFGDINMQGNNILDVGRISGMFGTWSIDAEGKLLVKDIETEKLKVGTQEKPAGITLYDEVTKEPYCVKIRNGAMLSEVGECGSTTRLSPASSTDGTSSVRNDISNGTSTETAIQEEIATTTQAQ